MCKVLATTFSNFRADNFVGPLAIGICMIYFLLFLAQFAQVFALVMSSKLLRDDRWVLAMGNSVLISITQCFFIYTLSTTNDPMTAFYFSAVGGSLGCGASHLFYTRFIFKGK